MWLRAGDIDFIEVEKRFSSTVTVVAMSDVSPTAAKSTTEPPFDGARVSGLPEPSDARPAIFLITRSMIAFCHCGDFL